MNKQVPRSALRFSVGALEFGDNGEGAKTAPFRMVARTGDPINHYYWGKVVHDMSGLQLNHNRITIDYNHNPDEVLGWANKFDTQDGNLNAGGTLQSVKPNDRAAEVIERGKGGQPYEASIFFDDNVVLEKIEDGETVLVNGREVTGEAIVIRQWSLRGIAVCPYGADKGTSTQFAEGDMVQVSFINKENETMNETEMVEAGVASEVEVTPAVETEVCELASVQPVDETQVEPSEPTEVEAAISVTVMVDAVATVETEEVDDVEEEVEVDSPTVEPSEAQPQLVVDGVNGFTSEQVESTVVGKAVVELSVNAEQITMFTQRIATLEKENSDMKARLSALSAVGETKPVAFAAEPEQDTSNITKYTKRGVNPAIAGFAASLKLPK